VAVSTIKLVNLCCRAVIGSVNMRESMGGRRLPSSRMAAGFKTARAFKPTAEVPPMAGRGGAGGPAEGYGKKLVINKHVRPGRGVDAKRRPFNVAVETADCISVPGKVYSVANPAAINICGRL